MLYKHIYVYTYIYMHACSGGIKPGSLHLQGKHFPTEPSPIPPP